MYSTTELDQWAAPNSSAFVRLPTARAVHAFVSSFDFRCSISHCEILWSLCSSRVIRKLDADERRRRRGAAQALEPDACSGGVNAPAWRCGEPDV